MEIRELHEDEKSALKQGLEMASRMAGKPLPISIEDVQRLYDYLIRKGEELDEIEIAVGLAFGQVIVDRSGYDWVRISDEYGEETVISPQGWDINLAPISIIRKRIAARENVDLHGFANQLIGLVEEKIASGELGVR